MFDSRKYLNCSDLGRFNHQFLVLSTFRKLSSLSIFDNLLQKNPHKFKHQTGQCTSFKGVFSMRWVSHAQHVFCSLIILSISVCINRRRDECIAIEFGNDCRVLLHQLHHYWQVYIAFKNKSVKHDRYELFKNQILHCDISYSLARPLG